MKKSYEKAMAAASAPQCLSINDAENRVGGNGHEERTLCQAHNTSIPDP